jgi:hypothetical protein
VHINSNKFKKYVAKSQIKRGKDGHIKEKEPCTSIVQTSKTLKIHYEKLYDF